MNKEDLVTYKQVDKLLAKPWATAEYIIYNEITCYQGLNEEDTLRLVTLGLQVYRNLDNATPTGVACAITNLVYPYIEHNYSKIKTIMYEDIENNWMSLDRT